MSPVATFDPQFFAARYPEFAGIVSTTAPGYFLEAGLYLNNTGSGVVQDAGVQKVLMHMLTAHLAELNDESRERGSGPLVGRISDAAEGSVKVHAEMAGATGNSAWFQQTKYGAAFWQATARFRTMRYVLPRRF